MRSTCNLFLMTRTVKKDLSRADLISKKNTIGFWRLLEIIYQFILKKYFFSRCVKIFFRAVDSDPDEHDLFYVLFHECHRKEIRMTKTYEKTNFISSTSFQKICVSEEHTAIQSKRIQKRFVRWVSWKRKSRTNFKMNSNSIQYLPNYLLDTVQKVSNINVKEDDFVALWDDGDVFWQSIFSTMIV